MSPPADAVAASCDGTDGLIGRIERVDGRWTILPDEKKAEVGTCVFSGDSLQKDDGPSSGRVAVLLFSGQPFDRDCTRQACSGALRIPEPPARHTGLQALYAAFWNGGRPVPPVFAAARGTGAELAPALAVVEAGGLNLKAAVSSIEAGDHAFRLRPQVPAAGAAITFRMTVPAGVAAGLNVPAGLYALDRLNASGEPVGAAAAVLVLTRPDPERQALFDAAVAEAASWTNADASLVRSFLTQAVVALHR